MAGKRVGDLTPPKKDSEIERMTGSPSMKTSYKKMNSDYKRLYNHDFLFCCDCGEWKYSDTDFYRDDRFGIHRFPICKQCLRKKVEQRTVDGISHETAETVKPVLYLLDRPFLENFYQSCVDSVERGEGKYKKESPFVAYITAIISLPQYKNKKWKDSAFIGFDRFLDNSDEDAASINENSRLIRAARKRFGRDFELSDLQYLETQYEDWVSRYECQTKSQEELFERLSFKKWEIMKATKAGESTERLDRTYQDLLNTANITPKQTGMDSFADAQTLGTLIQKWEETRPLPEIDPELQDVDKIGLYIDAFFRGHTSKMLGIKNKFSNIYEKVMSKYTVKPPEYEDDEASEVAFNKIFGTSEDF